MPGSFALVLYALKDLYLNILDSPSQNLGLTVRQRGLAGPWGSNLKENELATATFGNK